jgi:hypothetical protein
VVTSRTLAPLGDTRLPPISDFIPEARDAIALLG